MIKVEINSTVELLPYSNWITDKKEDENND